MGNHEWCEDCHESNFHIGQECNPIKKAAVDKEKQKLEEERHQGLVLLEELKEKLLKSGHAYVDIGHAGSYDYITITGFSLVRAEEKRN